MYVVSSTILYMRVTYQFPKTSMSILIPTEQLDDDKTCLNKVFLITYFAAHYAKHFSIN